MYIRTKDAKNDRKLMTFIFGGDIRPISYIVPLMKSSSKKVGVHSFYTITDIK